MFTGLVKCMGTIKGTTAFGNGKRFRINIGEIAENAKVGQSIAINGVCLTVTALKADEADFDAVAETVSRTNLGRLKPGGMVNLEPALTVGDALDGHFVSGHVDALANVLDIAAAEADNRIVTVALPGNLRHLVAEKGSIAINGISLTVADAADDRFTVAVIPHTWSNTTLALLKPGDGVNIEVDVMARYAARIMQFNGGEQGISEDFLRRNGFA